MKAFDSLNVVEKVNQNFNTDIPPQTDEEDFGFFKSHRGAKQPVRITFEMGVKRLSLRWQLSDSIACQGDTITIVFVSHTVTIKGKGLGKLEDYLHREKAFWVRESKETGEQIPSYVEKITITPRE
jgi:hypothetical protein